MPRNNEIQARVKDRLATYEPRSVTAQQWETIRGEIELLVIAAEPPSEAEVSALVATLLVFLQQTCPTEKITLEVLTPAKVEDFIHRKQAAGTPTGTLQQLRPRLRRLVRAYCEQEIWCRRIAARPRVTPFDPHSDDEVRAMLAVRLSAHQRRAVDVAFALCEQLGLSRIDACKARVEAHELLVGGRVLLTLEAHDPLLSLCLDDAPLLDPHDLASARTRIEQRTGISLRLTRLRHRFLQRIAALRGVCLADLMVNSGLGRDDIEVLIPITAPEGQHYRFGLWDTTVPQPPDQEL